MIHVVSAINLNQGVRAAYQACLERFLPRIRAEEGCISYEPCIDIEVGLAIQEYDVDRVVIIEEWQSIEALREHFAAPHMDEYREAVKDLVKRVDMRVLKGY